MDKLASGSKCYGCAACSETCPVNAIVMLEDKKGFKYPSIDSEQCIHCNKCVRVCQGVHFPQQDNENCEIFALQHKDDSVLTISSSGGAFIAISDYVLANGGIVVGAVFDPKTKRVTHRIAHNNAERNLMCGSKYVQSDIIDVLSTIREEINSRKLVMFSGTPCQISAVKAFLGNKNYENLVTVDLICHGVPSPKVFASYIEYEEKKHSSTIEGYSFRSKKYGYEYTTEITFTNGTNDSSIDAKRLLKLYTMNMRESCYACQFASKERVGDITIGDMWQRPESVKVKNHAGCSTVFLNTKKGKRIFEEIEDTVTTMPVQINTEKRQALSRPVTRKPKVDTFWEDYFEHGIAFVLDKYARVSLKSRAYFSLIKFLHKTKQFSLIEKIKKHVSEI